MTDATERPRRHWGMSRNAVILTDCYDLLTDLLDESIWESPYYGDLLGIAKDNIREAVESLEKGVAP